jgi:hypothetical protein
MALIGFRAPALPLPREQYDRQQMDQLINALRLYFNQLDSLTPQQANSYRADEFIGGFFVGGVSSSVTATGTTQNAAVELTSSINNVTVVTATNDGVRLPTAVPGVTILVRNSDAADTLKIYPATGAEINALGANNSYSLTAGSVVQLFATTTTQWYTI